MKAVTWSGGGHHWPLAWASPSGPSSGPSCSRGHGGLAVTAYRGTMMAANTPDPGLCVDEGCEEQPRQHAHAPGCVKAEVGNA